MQAITVMPPAPTTASVSRAVRLQAAARDAVAGAVIGSVALAVAVAWLFGTSDGGAQDVDRAAATVGWAILLAAVPAWLSLLAISVPTGATPGQRSSGLRVLGTPQRRLIRLAAHPFGATGWLWAASVLSLATVPVIPLLLAAVGVIVAGAGIASLVLLLIAPEAPALHDRLAGTRLVAS